MDYIYIPTSSCKSGDVIAFDVITNHGATLIIKNTTLNNYIIKKLIKFKIEGLWIYETKITGKLGEYDSMERLEVNYKGSIAALKKSLINMLKGEEVNLDIINSVSKTIYAEVQEDINIIKCLNSIKDADEYTYSHSINVAFYSMLICKWLGLSETEILRVIEAALLHDIGKIKIESTVLNKKGKLTPDEFETIKKHTVYGYEILKSLKNISKDERLAVLMHHEKEDGSGYPFGAKGDKINRFAKIISIADVYDAITSDRVYKKRNTPFEAFQFFQISGIRYFDLIIMKEFLSHISALYIGFKVRLSSGDIGQIVYIPPFNITEPIVQVNSNYIDLSKNSDIKILSIF